MKLGFPVWAFSAILAAALLSCAVLALTPDGVALLELKSTLNDTKNALSNWQFLDDSPCKWTGISCHPEDQTVLSISLPYMQLGGIISPSIGKLSRLQRLALHQNSLHGVIPNEITKCTELRALYLRGNYLQGGIPSAIGNLSHLTVMDLSSNSLKGAIPSSIGRLTRLSHLNLSTNFFSGEIPDVGVLSTFGLSSFVGNFDLCGQQVQKPCRTSMGFPVVLPHASSDEAAVPAKRSSHYLKGAVIGAMTAMGLALFILLGFLWICLVVKKERAAKRYTEVKKQANSEPIKKLDRSREGSADQVLERELEILGSIKHINLMNTLLQENRLEDIVDERCTDADPETVEAVLDIAAKCTDANPDERPSMNQVLQLLEQEVISPCASDFYESHSDYS
ncbi:hypothetical protein SAY87_004213 [Trapa incisa]|uniref:Leucine-rich repeat-containing N-terminal plant-type domain-containing protein n=1 Tax=Trapa incisa TaxID=236973 RepID=A0AAN7JNP7_9MYRT|nr:hypothetical protein SAY87_004213 [Trapa incisa]